MLSVTLDFSSSTLSTGKGVIQGYAAQAAVDSSRQVMVAADVTGSGSEHAMLLPMIEKALVVKAAHTLFTADAGYYSKENVATLCRHGIPAWVADKQMRQCDQRFAQHARHMVKPDPLHDKSRVRAVATGLFRPWNFVFDAAAGRIICPAGQQLYSTGSRCKINGRLAHKYTGTKAGCGGCALGDQCLRHPQRTLVRQVYSFERGEGEAHAATQTMRDGIDSPKSRALYNQRIGTVEPVFGDIRHIKRMNRFTLRGKAKVTTRWNLYCMVHNIEKLATAGKR